MPWASAKTDLVDTQPLEKKPSVSFEKLLDAVAFGNRERDVLSSLASRLARLDRQLNKEDQKMIAESAGGQSLSAITRSLVDALILTLVAQPLLAVRSGDTSHSWR